MDLVQRVYSRPFAYLLIDFVIVDYYYSMYHTPSHTRPHIRPITFLLCSRTRVRADYS